MTADRGSTPGRTSKPRFIFLLSIAHRRLQSAIHGDGDGTSAARSGLLMTLRANGESMAMAQLARSLDLGASTLSGLIDRMVRDGLIVRQADANDGRAWNIALTDNGKRARAEAVRAARMLNDRLRDGFSDAELAIVARWLDTVRTKFPKESNA